MNTKIRIDNKSGYKGVHWSSSINKWKAQLYVNFKLKHIGSYADKIEAAIAYNEAAKKYYGEFARLNTV